MIREMLNDHEDIFDLFLDIFLIAVYFGSIIFSYYPKNEAAYAQSSWTSW